ncbi:MAG: hypothetical protein HC899_37325, partial [Leptolyngbyaceae cyanobacterium SM1_4_3]|nr:hypothetical protein [Leptolyngbyaceae cyanobacterium SM1_4_3]
MPDSTPPASLQPLTRETFAQHWQHLSTLASLSMADAVNALETPLLSEYDLALISRDRAEDLPTAGRSLVVVAKIGDSYHARIFDCTGTLVLDKGNGEFSPDGTLVQKLDAALRNSLENKLTDASTKHELIQKVTSSLNYTFKEPVLIQNLIEPLEWPVQIGFNLTTYPGTINL